MLTIILKFYKICFFGSYFENKQQKSIMKKIFLASALALGAGAFITTTTTSCMSIMTSSLGLSIIKKVLLGGITKGLGIFGNKQAFLENDLIDQALPSQLRQLNSVLHTIAPSLVAKEKDYIAQAAAYTVNLSQPILVDAVNNLTETDVQRIMQGPSGTATEVLKEKTAHQLAAAIMPKVDEKLNQFGLVSSLNMALQGNNMLGSIFGGQNSASLTGGISKLASEQMVNGLFKIIDNYEKENSGELRKALGK